MEKFDDCRVISIQSHVVSGYVGNKSATFPLQVLGFEVDTINSVQFSNHTGYRVFKGQVLTSQDLADVYSGLKSNDLNRYSHLLTGYIGSVSFLEEVKEVIVDLKRKNPDLIYVCDPVLGDNGQLYVPKDLLPVYCNSIIPLADVVTPNQYEAELLTEVTINSISAAVSAIKRLHDMGAKTVVISSMELGSDDTLVQIASRIDANGQSEMYKMNIPRLKAEFTGTGDLYAALLLAWMHRHPDNLKLACEKVISTMSAVLRRTLDWSRRLAGPGNAPTPAQRELRLIQSKSDIENPEITVQATPLTLDLIGS